MRKFTTTTMAMVTLARPPTPPATCWRGDLRRLRGNRRRERRLEDDVSVSWPAWIFDRSTYWRRVQGQSELRAFVGTKLSLVSFVERLSFSSFATSPYSRPNGVEPSPSRSLRRLRAVQPFSGVPVPALSASVAGKIAVGTGIAFEFNAFIHKKVGLWNPEPGQLIPEYEFRGDNRGFNVFGGTSRAYSRGRIDSCAIGSAVPLAISGTGVTHRRRWNYSLAIWEEMEPTSPAPKEPYSWRSPGAAGV